MKELKSLIADDVGSDIVRLTINRPKANALNADLISKLLAALTSLGELASPPGIVLMGQGDRFFSAGGDIGEVASGVEIAAQRMKNFHALLVAFERYPGPIVCAVKGYAVGGALELLLHADYVVADHQAKVGFPEIKHGLLPAAKGIRQAVRHIGRKAAQRLLFSGDLIDAIKAHRLDIIDEIVDTPDVAERAIAVCREMRAKDARLFAALKRSVNLPEGLDDQRLESITIEDLEAYIGDDAASDARRKFFDREHS